MAENGDPGLAPQAGDATEEFLVTLQSSLDHPVLTTRLSALRKLQATLRQSSQNDGKGATDQEDAEDAEEGEDAAVAEDIEFGKPQARALARILAEARLLVTYREPRWLAALDASVAAAVLSPRAPSFSQACVAHAAAVLPARSDSRSLVGISRFLDLVIRAAATAGLLNPPPEWLQRAVETQAAAMDALAAAGAAAPLRGAGASLRRTLAAAPSALPRLYADFLLALPQAAGAAALGEVVAFYVKRLPEAWAAADGPKAAAIDLYLREALQAKVGQQLPPHHLDSFAPLLASLTDEDFATALQPALEKALKKNPDSALPAAAALCGQAAGLDLSPHLEPLFLPPLLRQLRSQKDDVRALALAAMERLLARCGSATAVAHAAAELSAVAAGKAGVLAQWYQRHCVLAALRAVAARAAELAAADEPAAAATAAAAAAAAAVTVIAALCPAIEKESHEPTRALGLRCLADWLALAGEWPAEAVALFRKGSESVSKPVATAYLAALSELAYSCGLPAELLPVLAKKAADGARRAAVQQPEAVFAAAAIIEVAAAAEAAATAGAAAAGKSFPSSSASGAEAAAAAIAAASQLPLDALADSGSAFYSSAWFSGGGAAAAAAIAQTAADDAGASALAALCRLLGRAAARSGGAGFNVLKPLALPAAGGGSGGLSTSAPCLVLVLCAMAPSDVVSRAADAAIATLLSTAANAAAATGDAAAATGDAAAAALLAALRLVLRGLAAAVAAEAARAAASSLPSKDAADDTTAAAGAAAPARGSNSQGFPPPSRIRRALLIILGPNPPAASLPAALLLAHHPLAAHSARGGAALWGRAAARFAGGAGAAAALLEASVAAAAPELLLVALAGDDAGERAAAAWAAPSLAGRCGDAGGACAAVWLLPGIAAALPADAVAALTADELAIHATPEGVAYGTPAPPPPPGDGAGGGGKGGAAVRRGKGAGREDAAWEEEVRRELEAKRKAKLAKQEQGKGGGGGGAAANGASGPAGEEAAALAQLLSEESATRRRVEALRLHAAAQLAAAAAALAACPTAGPAAAEPLLAALLPLLRSPLVRAEAFACLAALCRSLDAPLRARRGTVAAAALAALELLPPPAAAASAVAAACLARVAQAVVPEYGEEAAMSAAGFGIVLPLLCAVLRHPKSQADCETALQLVAAHAEGDIGGEEDEEEGEGEAEESGGAAAVNGDAAAAAAAGAVPPALLRQNRRALAEAVLAALQRFPRAEPAADVVLAELCAGAPLLEEEWAPLLGDAGLLSDEAHVRKACLTAILMASMQGQSLTAGAPPLLESRLWLACSDENEDNRRLADDLWAERDAPLGDGFAPPLLELLPRPKARVRQAAGRALAAALLVHPAAASATLDALCKIYKARSPRPRRPKKKKGAAGIVGGSGGKGGGKGSAAPAEIDMAKFFAAPVGMEGQEEEFVDPGWVERSGVARALESLGLGRELDGVPGGAAGAGALRLFAFVAREGLADYNDTVRAQMLAAGTAIVGAYGGERAAEFLAVCDAVVEAPFKDDDSPTASAADADVQCFDWRREGVVVLTGSAAANLAEDDPRAGAIADTLMAALSTPSEAVQRAVAGCLEKLVRRAAVKARGPELLKRLLAESSNGATYGARRGAAFGLAAAVKGLGIAVLKREGVMAALEENCRGAQYQQRQGALCAFECMCERLGLLFEPYVIVILPLLLKCSSDASPHVREAAGDCARAIMANLSAHGVKLVVPAILSSLSDPAWRTNQAAIQLLGAMAYCAPRQLAACLPQVVPRLGEALADTHPKVRESGRKALEDIGSVIRNPEVARLSMVLMSALADPAKHSRAALEALLACEFLHSIDAPSLALLVPVLQRGLRDRSADLKRKAALITGNTVSMVSDAGDLVPYLPALLPGLKGAALDPIPDVRATAGKALGLMVRGMGEARLGGDLLPWLTDALKADSSTSERSGAAQALSEVLSALGPARAAAALEELLPLAAAHPRPAVREGVLWTLAFLPAALGRDFAPLIGDALPAVLAGLADEAEPVRDVALRAGQAIVATHGSTHANQLLPALESGLFDDSWRIRQSSVQLLGDLLCLLGDTRRGEGGGGGDDNDEDGGSARVSARAGAAVEAALGKARRDSVLASLYLVRSDTSAVVRQGAVQVWKALVPHTARALREVLPALLAHILRLLASSDAERRVVGGRALGDLVRRLGDDVLPEAVPHLRKGLAEGDEAVRQGVCLGLAEVFESATRRQLEHFLPALVPAVQEALCDPSGDVREQAARAFQMLNRMVGAQAVEQVVPALLQQLALAEEEAAGGDGDADAAREADDLRQRAVYGFKEVVQLRPRELLPYVIPKLIARPMTVAHARALAAAAEVTGGTIHYHLNVVIPALLGELAATDDGTGPPGDSAAGAKAAAVRAAAVSLVSSVEEVGVNWLCTELTGRIAGHDDARQRAWAAWMLEQFLLGTKANFDPQVPMLLKELMTRLADTDPAVLSATLAALRALNTRVTPDRLVPHLTFCRNVLASVVSDARHRRGGHGATEEFLLPGLNQPRGLEPLLPMYQQGLMYGSPEVREMAAAGLGELVEMTSAKSLQPLVIKITGPLIRIVGDRFPPAVKAAILHTLGILLGKGGVALKPFVPQLQTTFVKALADASNSVRQRGAAALKQLMALGPRVDPLITELTNGAVGMAGGAAVAVTMLDSLTAVLEAAGARAGGPAVTQSAMSLAPLLGDADEAVRGAAARALATALAYVPQEASAALIDSSLLASGRSDTWELRHGRILALAAALKVSPAMAATHGREALAAATQAARDERPDLKAAGLKALAQLVAAAAAAAEDGGDADAAATFFAGAALPMAEALGDGEPQVVIAALAAVKLAAKRSREGERQATRLLPPLLRLAKDGSGATKAAAERALLYVLEVHTRPQALAELEGESARPARELTRRVLLRLPKDSDDEADA